MEPGHEDREYNPVRLETHREQEASMEPGHEDREYTFRLAGISRLLSRLNGARS